VDVPGIQRRVIFFWSNAMEEDQRTSDRLPVLVDKHYREGASHELARLQSASSEA
jgi:hypothetical protein